MAVAVKPDAELRSGGRVLSLANASLIGTLYALVGFVAAYHLIPYAWKTLQGPVTFFGNGLRLLLMVLVAAAFVFAWPRLVGRRPGLRAGVAVGVLSVVGAAVMVFLVAYLSSGLSSSVSGGLTMAAALLSVFLIWRTFHKPAFQDRLQSIEDQGWFSTAVYKKGQGLRTRRLTMLGILVVVGCGLWVYSHRGFGWGTEWTVDVPFAPDYEIPLLRTPVLSLTVVVGLLALWFSWRLVNYPRFADFLIATEGEMHKVTWTSRKRVIQDTVVVLSTVAFLTVFLFTMDLMWRFVLHNIFRVLVK